MLRLLLVAAIALAPAGCLDDLEPTPPETICTFTRTPFQQLVLDRLGVAEDDIAAHRCRQPEEYTVTSPLPGVPDAAIEPQVDIIRVEVLREVISEIDLDSYPCGEGGEDSGELAVCGSAVIETLGSTTVATFETDEPLPLAAPGDHYEIGFAFDSDGLVNNNTDPQTSPDTYRLRVDRWYEVRYAPGDGWTLDAFGVAAGEIIALSTATRLVIDGPVVALIAPLGEFGRSRPQLRLYILRHSGDRGRAPPHDWSGFVFPGLSESLF